MEYVSSGPIGPSVVRTSAEYVGGTDDLSPKSLMDSSINVDDVLDISFCEKVYVKVTSRSLLLSEHETVGL